MKAAFAEHFAQVDITDDNKNALLLECARFGLASRVRAVLQAGGKATHTDKDGRTALMLACHYKHEAAAAELIEPTQRAGGVSAADRYGNTALELAKDTAIFECLRAAGAKMPDITVYNRNNLLLRYAQNGHAPLLRVVLQAGANVNHTNVNHTNTSKRTWTPLHLAAEKGHSSVVVQLLEAGAAVNRKALWGFTPLRLADAHGHTEVARLLKEHSARRY